MKYLKIIFFYVLLISIYIILFEALSRTFIFFKTKEINIFTYGFNKNINFEISDLSELNFVVQNRSEINVSKLKKKNPKNNSNKIIVWTFGASLTYGYSCGEKSSSWPDELAYLNNDLIVKNFGFPAMYSEDSIKKLIYNLKDNKIENPDIIIWAHRDEERLAIHKGINRNINRIKNQVSITKISPWKYSLLRIGRTSETHLTFFVMLNHAVKKINLFQSKNKEKPADKDMIIAIENFRWNSLDAINLSKKYGVKNFIILSLVSDEDINKNYKTFLNEYFKTSKELEKINNVFFINTSDKLAKRKIENIENFFCENRHFTLIGNKEISDIVNETIKNLN